MNIYCGLFTIAFSMLALEVALVRLLSVTTWYHLSFFAISTAMLGMTAGATKVYLKSDAFEVGRLEKSIGVNSIYFTLSIPVSLALLCLVPVSIYISLMSAISLFVTTAACALPFYFGGIIVAAVLTKSDRSIGRLYASDLIGASMGCIFVLLGLQVLDAPSVILLCGGTSALGGLCFVGKTAGRRCRPMLLTLLLLFIASGIGNSFTAKGIRPVMVKGEKFEPAITYLRDDWNSFSRVSVYPEVIGEPYYWGPSPLAPKLPIEQYWMIIDGGAGTGVTKFSSMSDIDHFRYDVTNIGYQVGRKENACIIGVGGGRDIQSAILFGCRHITGVEINPIFLDLLNDEFRSFAGIADHPDVTLIKAEARSFMTRTSGRYDLIQMSLIDTWAATGAGAFSLSENSLYTVEAWNIFLNRLTDDGIFTVSRWHNPDDIGETGRVVALAAGALLRRGVKEPAKHIALVTSESISTILVKRQPFSRQEIDALSKACNNYQFKTSALPDSPPDNTLLKDMLGAATYPQLLTVANRAKFNYTPPTDDTPYFFNMLRLRNIRSIFGCPEGVIRGNLIATLTLIGLLAAMVVMVLVTIAVPLIFPSPHRSATSAQSRVLWQGALYFSLIGAAFMLTEIALIQRLTILLNHPIYSLGILLFTIIASAGIGSLSSDFLPFHRRPWIFLYPIGTAVLIISVQILLTMIIDHMVVAALPLKILTAVAIIFPLGMMLGMFFPVGMRLANAVNQSETPWYWALNGICGVLSSVVAVMISIYVGISMNFYIAAVCYCLTLVPLEGLRRRGAASVT